MKRKRQESDEEHSSDDNAIKTMKGLTAPKTQGYASPLTVINEGEPLDSSLINEESKEDGTKRPIRATRAGALAKRQQLKKGSRKKNLPVTETSNEEQTNSSSMDEKPRRTTRHSRKKNLELEISTLQEKGVASSSTNKNKWPQRSTRNTRKKLLEEAEEISSTEELPSQPLIKKSKSSLGQKVEDSEEIVPAVIVKQEPVSPVTEIQTLRRSTRNSNSRKEEETETENVARVPETPDLPTVGVSKDIMSPPALAKICKATVHLVLQSPGFSVGKDKGVTPIGTSSPCAEQDHESHHVAVEKISQSAKREKADGDDITIHSPSPKSNPPDKSLETHKHKLDESEIENDVDLQEKLNHDDDDVIISENDCDTTGGIINESKAVVEKENMKEAGSSEVKPVKRNTQRSSGWRRRSKRSSCHLSPSNRRLSLKRTVTKSKLPGKKSLVKSAVKLKLTQSKLMPELKLSGTGQKKDETVMDPDLESVRVRLFDDLTSSSASASSAASHSSSSSTEDKVDAPMEKLSEAPVQIDAEEVFHDCRSENEADDEYEDAKEVKSDRLVHSVIHCKCSDRNIISYLDSIICH